MSEKDTRRWFVKVSAKTVYNSINTATLVKWAENGTLTPESLLSLDRVNWSPASNLVDLEMMWYLTSASQPPYGPIHYEVAIKLIESGSFPDDTQISIDPEQSPEDEPTHDEIFAPQNPDEQAAVLPQPHLRSDVEIFALECEESGEPESPECEMTDVVCQEPDEPVVSEESEGIVENPPPQEELMIQTLTEKLADLELQFITLQEQNLALNQRIAAISNQPPPAREPIVQTTVSDSTIYAILTQEYEMLTQMADQERDAYQAVQAIIRQRREAIDQRLLALRQLIQFSPEQMRHHALRQLDPVSMTFFNNNAELETRLHKQESLLTQALDQRSELERRLVAMEARERDFNAQIAQAQRQTRDSLRLEESLLKAEADLKAERSLREQDKEESKSIQRHLLRRIEELESASGQASVSIAAETEL